MEIQNAYKQKMSAQLNEWGAQVNLLEAKLENLGADMRIKRTEELQMLRAKQRAATDKMKELGEASGAAWEQVKNTADKIWDEMKAGLAAVQEKFK